ncbi:MAG: hypothetical protein HLUCCA11_23365 [Phormidesmis priestleyi Ana]|uniref:Uncharacterized protein n=1 Tax=Phormidesmis priestleyi Ana TaxID=1666911 RepID=A0A0P7ZPP7_9CYAN|nr:MAG: hypothetical protein HLUCCA11_23365 [Phormidesmis priestleyi Ana]
MGAVGVGEGFACAEFFEQIVHAGDDDFGVGGLDLFAVRVETITNFVDFLLVRSTVSSINFIWLDKL